MERLFSFAVKRGAAPIDDDADAAEQIRSNRAMIYRTIDRTRFFHHVGLCRDLTTDGRTHVTRSIPRITALSRFPSFPLSPPPRRRRAIPGELWIKAFSERRRRDGAVQ